MTAKFKIYNVNCPDIKNWYACQGEVEGVGVNGYGTSHYRAFKDALKGYYVGRKIAWEDALNK